MNMQYLHLLSSLDLTSLVSRYSSLQGCAPVSASSLPVEALGATSTKHSTPISSYSLFLSDRTVPPEVSPVTSGYGQTWLRWHLTSTRKALKTSSAAWTWKQPCTGLTLCPMMCAVTPRKRCWSECRTSEASSFFYFLFSRRMCWLHWALKR